MMSVALAAVAHEQGADVFGINAADNQMMHARISPSSQAPLTPLTPLGGVFRGAPVAAAGARLLDRPKDVTNHMRARCRHDNVGQVTWFPANGDWFSLGTGIFTSAPTVTVNDSADCDVLALGTKNEVYHLHGRVPPYANAPADWYGLGGSFNSPPAAVRMTQTMKSTSGFLHVFAIGDDNQLRHKCLTPSAWLPGRNDWQIIGGPFNSAPAAAYGNRIWVFALNTDNRLLEMSWDDTQEALPRNLAWDDLGGAFNPEP